MLFSCFPRRYRTRPRQARICGSLLRSRARAVSYCDSCQYIAAGLHKCTYTFDGSGVLLGFDEDMSEVEMNTRVFDCLSHLGEDLNSSAVVLLVFTKSDTNSLSSVGILAVELQGLVEELNRLLIGLGPSVLFLLCVPWHLSCDLQMKVAHASEGIFVMLILLHKGMFIVSLLLIFCQVLCALLAPMQKPAVECSDIHIGGFCFEKLLDSLGSSLGWFLA